MRLQLPRPPAPGAQKRGAATPAVSFASRCAHTLPRSLLWAYGCVREDGPSFPLPPTYIFSISGWLTQGRDRSKPGHAWPPGSLVFLRKLSLSSCTSSEFWCKGRVCPSPPVMDALTGVFSEASLDSHTSQGSCGMPCSWAIANATRERTPTPCVTPQTSLTKRKFKDNVAANFKTATAEHQWGAGHSDGRAWTANCTQPTCP